MGLIPRRARLVFDGTIFKIYRWRQRMYDGSYAVFEKARMKHTVKIIAVAGGKVMVTREMQPHLKQPRIGLFGGGIEGGETPLGAAKRELREEAGLASGDWKLLHVATPLGGSIDWKVYMFVARDCVRAGTPAPDSGERITFRAVGFDEFLEIADKRMNRAVHAELVDIYHDRAKRMRFRRMLMGK